MEQSPTAPANLRVEPMRIINILKARLMEEQAKSALFEAALQECQEREQVLIAKYES